MAKPITYREQEKIENTVKLREFLMELPHFGTERAGILLFSFLKNNRSNICFYKSKRNFQAVA